MLHFTPECLDLDDELHSPRFLSAGTEAQGSYSRHPRYHTDASSTLIDQASLNDMTLALGWGGKLMSVYMETEGEEPAENI